MLFEARGIPVSFDRLRQGTGMPQGELEEALRHMIASGLVVRRGEAAYEIPEAR